MEIRKRLNINYDKVVLAVGQFIYRKGFDILIKAINEINLDENIGFYIIGGKPTQEILELYEVNKHKERIHFIDFLTDVELEDYYKASTLFILPTREDVWGLVINEALSKGLPVVSTYNCVAAVELVKDGINGYIINKDTTNQLGNAIIKSLSDQSRIFDMSKNALKSIREYSIESMAHIHYVEILKIISLKNKT